MGYRLFLEKTQAFKKELGLVEHEPMYRHTTFQIGGPAEVFVQPRNLGAFMTALQAARESGLPLTVIGRGSNLLVCDEGVPGVVLCTCGMNGVRVEGRRVIAEAGATMAQLAQAALHAGLTGAEFAAGIPGTVGGGVFMNAGAYDGEMSGIVTRSVYMDENGGSCALSGAEQAFGYRTSIYKQHPEWVIIEAECLLKPGDPAEIRAKMDDFARRRREKQPLNFPSAGSTFKRPEGYFAGRLIEGAGLKGASVGGAQVSEKHAGFVINHGGATCADVTALIEHIQKTVFDRFGVHLECEVRTIG
ncbi:MAG: UDP-N-acetylmuramate dehydrogenase [Clostridiaceae bacterium]|jgi:UDP-N-acetylmuramate dehydrogenase|nr:UDP-N-acetylmuramate dehydrogenase [Clostridiaceae bacterium]